MKTCSHIVVFTTEGYLNIKRKMSQRNQVDKKPSGQNWIPRRHLFEQRKVPNIRWLKVQYSAAVGEEPFYPHPTSKTTQKTARWQLFKFASKFPVTSLDFRAQYLTPLPSVKHNGAKERRSTEPACLPQTFDQRHLSESKVADAKRWWSRECRKWERKKECPIFDRTCGKKRFVEALPRFLHRNEIPCQTSLKRIGWSLAPVRACFLVLKSPRLPPPRRSFKLSSIRGNKRQRSDK